VERLAEERREARNHRGGEHQTRHRGSLARAVGAVQRDAAKEKRVGVVKRVLLVVMALFYVVAGANHFWNPEFYRPIMPPYLPYHDPLIYISGVAEIVLGLAVLVPRLRVAAAWGIILLLIAIFPANLHVALYNVPLLGQAEGLGIWNWVRLPFQLVLIAWAWWYTRPIIA
jgi:uncharacterized membrane protein